MIIQKFCSRGFSPCPSGGRNPTRLKGSVAKTSRVRKKKRTDQQHGVDVGHQHQVAVAVGKGDDRAVDRENHAPKEQAASLPSPQRRKFVKSRQRSFRMVPDVAQMKSVGQQPVPKDGSGACDQCSDRVDCVVAALDQPGVAAVPPPETRQDATDSEHQRGQQDQMANVVDHGRFSSASIVCFKVESCPAVHPAAPG